MSCLLGMLVTLRSKFKVDKLGQLVHTEEMNSTPQLGLEDVNLLIKKKLSIHKLRECPQLKVIFHLLIFKTFIYVITLRLST